MINKETVYARIKDTRNLPTLPEALLQLLSACEDEDVPISEISTIIGTDPSISAKVLQLVNSAHYGFRQSFSSIEQAVIYLGANTIKNLAITMSVHHVFGSGKDQHQEPADFWWQSLMCASIAKQIAATTGMANSDEAYLAGLLHNIGTLTLASTFAKEYKTIAEHDKRNGDLLDLEKQTLGLNHCEAGSWIIRQWNLNPLIADAILYHHAPYHLVKEAFSLVQVIYAANQITENFMEPDQQHHGSDAHNELLGIQEDIDDITTRATEEVEAMAASMGIRVSTKFVDDKNSSEHSVSENETSPNQSAEGAITARVKNISLLTTFLEELVQADTAEEMISAFESSVRLLLQVDKVLFFLPDEKNIYLNGNTSSQNPLQEMCSGLALPLEKSTSLIISTYQQNSTQKYIKAEETENIADRQILSIFDTDTALPIYLSAKGSPVGVLTLGLTKQQFPLAENDEKLLRTLSQQLALSLHFEQQKKIKAQELHHEKMKAISMTARKFSHELNNPLGIISNYIAGMKLKRTEDHSLLKEIDIIDEEIKRISSMVNQMQEFAQAPFTEFERIDINSIIADIVQLSQSSLFTPAELSLSFIPGSDIPILTTSKDALKQILINLLKNAAEAMPGGGRVIVRTKKRVMPGLAGNIGAEIIISDTGQGLPEYVKENFAQPFVTTKGNGHSGLGLSIINKVVQDIGGQLSCTSTQTEGTTFKVTLPQKAQPEIQGE